MISSFEIFKFAGISVFVHYSIGFASIFFPLIVELQFLPSRYPDCEMKLYLIVSLISVLLMFVSVLIHEMSHCIIASLRGFKVKRITLFVLGGMSFIKDETCTAYDEILICISGPAISLVLSFVFWILLNLFTIPGHLDFVEAIVYYMAILNLVLFLFNMVPALPLDGGRIIRATIWSITGNYTRATFWSAMSGYLVGIALIGLGSFYLFLNGMISGLWYGLLGIFILYAARQTIKHDHVNSHDT